MLDSLGVSAALVELKGLTGRKHQLRLHCAEQLGTPILGDQLHGSSLPPRLWESLGGDVGMHLHAWQLTIAGYGAGGRPLHVTAPLPTRFQLSLDKLELQLPAKYVRDEKPRIRWSRPKLTRFQPSKRK